MHYDIATKVLLEKCREEILRRLVGISVMESTLLEELPQETVSLRRADFPILVKDEAGRKILVLLEMQSRWDRQIPLRLLEYRSRYLLKYRGEAVSCVLLLRPSKEALDGYEDSEVTFRFRLIPIYQLDARPIIAEKVFCLMPFVPLMQHGQALTQEADELLYESSLPRADKADMLTVMTILSGLVSRELPGKLLSRRRDIMIESSAYDLIKQEGVKEGLQQGLQQGLEQGLQQAIVDNLETRLGSVPQNTVSAINRIKDITALKSLHKISSTADSLEMFKEALSKVAEV